MWRKIVALAATLIGIPVFWYLIASVLIAGSPTFFLLCYLSAIAAGIMGTILELQRMTGAKKNNFAKTWFVVSGLFIPVFCLMAGGVAIGVDKATAATTQPRPTGRVSLPAERQPLTPEEKAVARDRYLADPLDSKNPWIECPSEANNMFDLTRTYSQYVINETFMERFSSHITHGRKHYSTLEFQVGHEQEWLNVTEYESTRIPDNANVVRIRANPDWRPSSNDKQTGVYWAVQEPHDAMVLRTEKLLRDGDAARWGRVWTTLPNGKALRVLIRVIFLDANYNPIPAERFHKFPPQLFLLEDSQTTVAQKANGLGCYHMLTDISSVSKKLANGRCLTVKIPAGFGDTRVLVNVKIH